VGRRILTSTLAIALLALTVLGVPLAFLLDRVVQDSARGRLQRQVDAIGLAMDDEIRAGRLPAAQELERLTPRGDWVLIRLDGARAEAGHRPPGETLAATATVGAGATVRLETSVRPYDARVRRSILVLLAVGAIGLCGAAVLAVLQARRFARPLEGLARAADRLGAGDFSAPVPRCGLTEIDAVADALEDGGRRVAEMVRAERQFAAHASHQLRSSLTGLSLSLEEVAAEAQPAAADSVAAALHQVTRLSDTVEELLHLARTGRAGERRIFDAARLVGQHVEDWRPRFAGRHRDLDLVAPASVSIRAAPGALGQAVDVLLSNAFDHGGGRTTITVHRVEGRMELEINDEGRGVEPSARARLFDPAAATAEGHGIGLPLARLLVEAEGGSLDLHVPDTATFRLRLPAQDESNLDIVRGER
jgi:signal transduction histidine kinase